MSVDEVMNDLQTPWQEDPKPQGDCISRQEAIDALCEEYCNGHHDCKYYPKCENLRAIQKLPSVQPDIARDIATIIQNEQDMRVISQNAERNCKTCRYNGKEWDEEPCDSCTMGGDNNHYKPSVQPQRWIPVSEALPNDGVEVWVTIKGHDVIRCEEGETLEQAIDRINKIRWVTRGYWSEEEHGWNDPSFGCPLIVQPVAWMPIDTPEPWRGEEHETN